MRFGFLTNFLNRWVSNFRITYINNGWTINVFCLRKRSLCILIWNCNDSKLKIIVQSVLCYFKKSKRQKRYNVIGVSESKIKTTWNFIINVTRNVQTSDHIPPSLKIDNIQVVPDKVAGAFNIFQIQVNV